MIQANHDRGADAINSREPAGGEREGGNSAEPSAPAGAGGGTAGNTRGTVRGGPPRGRYLLFGMFLSAIGNRPAEASPLPVFCWTKFV